MALPPFPVAAVTDPVYEIVVLGSISDGGAGAKNCFNVFYYRLTTPGATQNKTNLKTIFNTTVLVPLRAAVSTKYNTNAVKIRNASNPGDLASRITIAGAGSLATASLPKSASVVCDLMSAYRSKSCRGFKKFGGAVEADTDDDILNATGTGHWTPVRDALKAAMNDADGNTWTPFILSRLYSKLTAPAVIYGVNVVDCKLILNIGTMRKRRPATAYAA